MAIPGLDVDVDRIADICGRHRVARLDVFGSVSRGEAAPGSDVDVLYELEPGARLGWSIEALTDELSEVSDAPSISSHATLCTSGSGPVCWPRLVSSMQRDLMLHSRKRSVGGSPRYSVRCI